MSSYTMVCVGFINSRSLMDRLPNKGSVQHTTLRTTRNSWAIPNTETIGRWDDPISNRKPWPRRNDAHFRLRPTSPTGALVLASSPPADDLSDQKAWPKHHFRLRPASPTGDAPNPCSLLSSDWRDQSRLGPTDRGRPLGKDQGTDGESKAAQSSQP